MACLVEGGTTLAPALDALDAALCTHILERLPPRALLCLHATNARMRQMTKLRRTACAQARWRLRAQARAAQARLQARAAFLACTCGLQAVPTPAESVQQILHALATSPDGLRDLSAATHKAMDSVSEQTRFAPAQLARLRQDMFNTAALVCLLAWRTQRRERAHEARVAATGNGAGAQQEGYAEQRGEQEQQLEERSTQTDHGASLRDMSELLASFSALATTENVSMRPCAASLALLNHYLQLEVVVWNMAAAALEQEGQEQGAEPAAAAAAVVLAGQPQQ